MKRQRARKAPDPTQAGYFEVRLTAKEAEAAFDVCTEKLQNRDKINDWSLRSRCCWACFLRVLRGPREFDEGFECFGRWCRVCKVFDDRGEAAAQIQRATRGRD